MHELGHQSRSMHALQADEYVIEVQDFDRLIAERMRLEVSVNIFLFTTHLYEGCTSAVPSCLLCSQD